MIEYNGLNLDKMDKDDFDEVAGLLIENLQGALELLEEAGYTSDMFEIKNKVEAELKNHE